MQKDEVSRDLRILADSASVFLIQAAMTKLGNISASSPLGSVLALDTAVSLMTHAFSHGLWEPFLKLHAVLSAHFAGGDDGSPDFQSLCDQTILLHHVYVLFTRTTDHKVISSLS